MSDLKLADSAPLELSTGLDVRCRAMVECGWAWGRKRPITFCDVFVIKSYPTIWESF